MILRFRCSMRSRWKMICVFKNKAPRGIHMHSVLYLSFFPSRHHLSFIVSASGQRAQIRIFDSKQEEQSLGLSTYHGFKMIMQICLFCTFFGHFFVYFLTSDSRSPVPAQASFSQNGNTSGACVCLPSLLSHAFQPHTHPTTPHLLFSSTIFFVFIPLQRHLIRRTFGCSSQRVGGALKSSLKGHQAPKDQIITALQDLGNNISNDNV